ncbi:hypothetical protein DRQ33_08105 [bacterium]|nr:MAG: hypothetical protein DRQ33_08105 [bacterium]
MKKIFPILIASIVLVIFGASLKELLRAGDHFMERGEYYDALAQYQNADRISPDNPSIKWRMGAAMNRIAIALSGKAKTDSLRKANAIITKAIWADKNIAEAHAELAWNLAYMGLVEDEFCDFAIAGRIKEEIDYALSLNPKCPNAHFILGLWHRQVSTVSLLKRKPYGLGDASIDESFIELSKAVNLKPDCALFKLELAKHHIITGDTIAAISMLGKIADMSDIPANRSYKDEAANLRRKLSVK